MFEFLPTLEDAANCVVFSPERLESVLDVDAEVAGAALEWLGLLDDLQEKPVSECVRVAIDSAAFSVDDAVVVRLTMTGDDEGRWPAFFPAMLTRLFAHAMRSCADVDELRVQVDRSGRIVLGADDPSGDPLLGLALQHFGVERSRLPPGWEHAPAAFGLDLRLR